LPIGRHASAAVGFIDDGSHLLQYGLIAEEVAKVYPEMVAYDNDGQVLTVKYQLLAPMLLNEVQKQAAKIRSLEDRLAALETLLGNVPATTVTGQ
jgi:Glu-tRNA(Gln) amidotransferase subunit E-like FAD-binding protein